ncbi:MAG: carbohydrate binding domain-containing protein [Candidatus Omnitrophica bacterium]|nr:carbohydrate binding domain-containing protein [Candidatus Omnitrophota bacterium]
MRRLTTCLLILVMLCLSRGLFAGDDQFDAYGGWTGLKGQKTGWFHTEKINDRWWIVTPEGNVFWSAGMYCVRFGGLPEKGTNKRVYQEACKKKYGSEKEWVRLTRLALKNWGFNTIGDWSSGSIIKDPGFAYVIGIDKSTKAPNVIPKGSYGYFPDVFDSRFKEGAREEIKKKLGWYPFATKDPWLVGYFLSDEPSWYGSKNRSPSLVDDFIGLDSQAAGKIAWVEFIKSKYKDIGDLNNSWKTGFKSFDELLEVKKITEKGKAKEDKLAFLEVIALEFSRVLAETLREYDKDHMILGTRPTRLYPEVVRGIGKYCDVFSMSGYELNQGYIIDSSFSQKMDSVYRNSGKPVMLGVSIAAQDTKLPYGIVKTQRDRGISYWRYLAKASSHPAVVGMHWFQYFDPPKKCYDPKAANWGLVNEKDEPYQEAVNSMSQANKMVYAYALGLADFVPDFGDTSVQIQETSMTNTERSTQYAVRSTKKIELSNAGFEEGNKAWAFQTWKGKPKVGVDRWVSHSGKRSAKIQGAGQGWDSAGVVARHKPRFVLEPSKQYRLSGWIKIKDVDDRAFLRIKVKYKGGDSDYFETPDLYGTQDWKYVEKKFSPRQENEVEYFACQLVGSGVAWFDDLELVEIIE